MKIVALAGGVGAARFISGFKGLLNPKDLTVIVNTGDDFEWLGLYISPDIDTIIYTLAGLANRKTGWGMRGETTACLERLGSLQVDTWFRVGDRDLATHIYRSNRLREGASLSEVTRELCSRCGVGERIVPMSDSPVPTRVETDQGSLDFQDYFVRRQHRPRVVGFTYQGSETALPSPGLIDSLNRADAILLCPSNPFISIAPILAIPGIRETLRKTPAIKIAITPIIGNQAIKGPAAKMLEHLGYEVSALSVATLYRDFLDIFVVDVADSNLEPRIRSLGCKAQVENTLMDSSPARKRLCRKILKIIR